MGNNMETLFADNEPTFDAEAFTDRIRKAQRVAHARTEAAAAMSKAEHNTDPTWADAAERIIVELARTGRHFTSDDIMDKLTDVETETPDPRALGPIVKRAITRQWIHRTGYEPSRRRHGSPIAVYVGII
jgi:hypothetical protein